MTSRFWIVPGIAAFAAVTIAWGRHPVAVPLAPTKTGTYTWRNVEIVAGGFVSGLEFHPKQPGLIYARTDIGGAYRWDAKSSRWIPLNDWASRDDGNMLGIESIGLDPSDPNRLYIAAGTYTNNWAGNGAILRSNDQGRTFQRTNLPFKLGGNEDGRSIGERLAVDPTNGKTILFGTRHNGLWKSVDQGATWKKVDSFPTLPDRPGQMGVVGVGLVVFDTAARAIYAGVANGDGPNLYRSTDGGAIWAAVPDQPGDRLVPHHVRFDGTGTLYVTYGNGPGPNGMTGGAVWKMDTKTGAWTEITPEKGGFGYAGLTLDPRRPGTIMVSTMDRWSVGDTLFRSTDGGKTWYDLKPKSERDASLSPYLTWGKPAADLGHWIGDLEIDPNQPGHVLYVTGATIWGTDDATNADKDQPTHWSVRARGLEETAVIDLISPSTGDAHLLSGLGDIGGFRHTDLNVSPKTGMYDNPRFSNTDSLDYAENAPNSIVRVGRAGNNTRRGAYSTDGGATWQPFVSEPPASRGSGSVAVSADGKTVIWTATGASGPYRTTDWGATWQPCTGLSARVSVVADRADARRFYAYNAGTLYESADRGATFTPATTDGPRDLQARLRAVPGHTGELWLAARDAGLWHITGGKTITAVPKVTAESVGTGKAAPGSDYPALYLVGTVQGKGGVFRSDDAGTTWVRVNDDQHQWGWIGGAITGDSRVYGRVYVGTNGRGIVVGEIEKMAP